VDAYVPGMARRAQKELVEFRDFLTWLTNQVQSASRRVNPSTR